MARYTSSYCLLCKFAEVTAGRLRPVEVPLRLLLQL